MPSPGRFHLYYNRSMVIAFLGLSDNGEGALIAVCGSIAVLLISLIFSRSQSNGERQARLTEKQSEIDARQEEQKAERKEWYRRLLFEKRLQAVQEAHKWALEILRLVDHIITSKPRDEALLTELQETVTKSRDWFDSNAVYLYDALSIPSNFTGVLNSADYFLRGGDFDYPGFNALWKELRERTQELMEPMREQKDPK